MDYTEHDVNTSVAALRVGQDFRLLGHLWWGRIVLKQEVFVPPSDEMENDTLMNLGLQEVLNILRQELGA